MSSSDKKNRYDLVVYGATGYTGQYIVEEVARVAELEKAKLGSKEATLQWAVAGRNKTKLLFALEEAKKETGLDLSAVGVLVADVGDEQSLDRMTSQAKVVINCVGPYMKYGEPVVLSCIRNSADHVDISGEPQFLEGMQLKHHNNAEENGVHIVGACGYDSIPAEMGVHCLTQQFPGGLNSVEMYMRVRSKGLNPIHTGTLESAVNAVANRGATSAQHRVLFPTRMPKRRHPVASRSIIHHNELLDCYGIPMPSDAPVVLRTQHYWFEKEQQQPVQFRQYLSCKTWWQGLGMGLGLVYFAIMAAMSWTRNLLLKYPEVLTGGFFSRAGASRQGLKSMSFSITFVGKGWTDKLSHPTDQHTEPPHATKVYKVEGPDPGYAATSLMLVSAAMTLLREKSLCTDRGGVLTPSVAFAKTNILERMRERGMKFYLQG
uniref:Saccharopine dehydrogenase oxidoreductase-like protein n=1 Tax=Hirondellea gigas TaxID=1518452 RepID=A0A2P2HX09_9CRUS